jgi:phosphatidate cytidylyltransferase
MCWEWARLTPSAPLERLVFPLVSVGLANLTDETLFLLGILVWVALRPLLWSSSSSTTAPTQLTAAAGVLLLTIPHRAWLSVSQHFCPTVSLLLTVWNCDTGALIFGRLGKALGTAWPQPPWLRQASPAKSLEGLVGGFVGGLATFLLLPYFWNLLRRYDLLPPAAVVECTSLTLRERLMWGSLLALTALLGDLWESTLKRTFGVKDTGKLLPGHGGVLDRFDSSLLAVLLYQYLLGQYGF